MRTIYIDPAYSAYYRDRLFDETDRVLNRDDTLAPFIRMRSALVAQGTSVHTADLMRPDTGTLNDTADYYSFGVLENYRALAARPGVHLRAFVIFEPPVVAPHLYRELPALTAAFERVYVHNTEGDGYGLAGVDRSRLRKLFWPQPRAGILPDVWGRQERQRRIVIINGNHKPASYGGELYGKRIKVMAELAHTGGIDLYGRGWERWWSRNSMWWSYWRNRRALMSIYKGSCESKNEVLGRYAFALCFENMAMKGYVTEKIFDCLYAGTIPVYLGATDISSLIPEACFIDYRNYSSAAQMWQYVQGLTDQEIEAKRLAGRNFIESDAYATYHDFLLEVVS